MQERFAKVPVWARVDEVLNQAVAALCCFAPFGSSGDWFEAEMDLGLGVGEHSALETQLLDWVLVASMELGLEHLTWAGGWAVQVTLWIACTYSVKTIDDNCRVQHLHISVVDLLAISAAIY